MTALALQGPSDLLEGLVQLALILVFVLGPVISAALKKKKDAQKGPRRPPSWMGRLGEADEGEVVIRSEPPRRRSRRPEPDPRFDPAPVPEFEEVPFDVEEEPARLDPAFDAGLAPVPDEEALEVGTAVPRSEAAGRGAPYRLEPAAGAVPSGGAEPALLTKKSRATSALPAWSSARSWREAVVLAEVLGPPVSCREDGGGPWSPLGLR